MEKATRAKETPAGRLGWLWFMCKGCQRESGAVRLSWTGYLSVLAWRCPFCGQEDELNAPPIDEHGDPPLEMPQRTTDRSPQPYAAATVSRATAEDPFS